MLTVIPHRYTRPFVKELNIKRSRKFLFVLLFSTIFWLGWNETPFAQAIITLDPNTTYQTITGWEVTDYAGDWPGHKTSYPLYMSDLLEKTVNNLGINRIRLEIYSGTESSTDCGQQFIDGDITEGQFMNNCAYIIENDNADPNTINSTGFKWTWLDHKIDAMVVPMKQLLEARGESLYINLNYVDFGSSPFEHYSNPEEYAEFMLAVFQHMQSKYGFVPDAIEVILEPDNSAWTGTHIGQVVVATANRLIANGFRPRFILPSTTSMAAAPPYFDAAVAVAGASQHIEELSYHRYTGVNDTDLQRIASRGIQYGINTSMLEWWSPSNGYETLYKDLTMGRNSAWQMRTILGLFNLDETDPQKPIVTEKYETTFFRQYSAYVRRGAVRIKATSTNSSFEAVAFLNTDDRYVVVVKTSAGGTITIRGLSPGTYGIKYTTSTENNKSLSDIKINSGEDLTTNIPSIGVITIYDRSSAFLPPAPPTGLHIENIK